MIRTAFLAQNMLYKLRRRRGAPVQTRSRNINENLYFCEVFPAPKKKAYQ